MGFLEGSSKAPDENQVKTDDLIQQLILQGQGGMSPKSQTQFAPILLSLNIDGHQLGQVLSSIAATSFDGQAPAFDGLGSFPNGDHQHTDK
jgi:hypothetical protein